MKKWFIIPVIGLLFSISAFGQAGFRPGYVIKTDRDTLNGLVYYGTDSYFRKECRFKRFDIARDVSYDPKDIIGYGFRNGRFFESKMEGKKNLFLECLLKGTISVYIYPGDLNGQIFIENQDAGLFQLTKTRNKIKDVGDLGDYKAVLNWLIDKSGKSSSQIIQVQFSAMAITSYLKSAGAKSGYEERGYARSESVHVLKDFSIVSPTSKMTFGLTGGYQYFIVGIPGTNLTPYFKAADFNTSYRPVAGVFLNRKFSKRSDFLSADIAAYYLQDTYYAYAEYVYNMDTYRDDILINFKALQVPITLKFMFGKGTTHPFIRLGGFKTFYLSNSYERLSEQEDDNEIYMNSHNDYTFSGEYGLTGGAGLDFRLGTTRKLSIEAMYNHCFQKITHTGASDIYNSDINSKGISLMARISL